MPPRPRREKKMIKLIHCADVHLGSAMTSRLPAQKSAERRREIRATFGRMADYAEKNGCTAVLLCGDVFDSDRPLKKDKEYFYNVVKAHPAVDFLYLRGNHDGEQSYEETPKNLKTFSRAWQYYDYGDAVIAGAELCRENCLSIYSSLSLPRGRTNIVMLHGQIADGSGADKINLAKLRGKNIDYLALGHVHTFSSGRIDGRGVYAYSGCLEGRGFDETGAKGFIMLEVEDGRISSRFVPFASRTVHSCECDVSGCADWLAAARRAAVYLPRSRGDMLRITLTGEVEFDSTDLAGDVYKELEPHCYCLSVKDDTRAKIDMAALAADRSLKGEFVRSVLAEDGYTEERRARIIRAGLKALAGRGDEL